MIAGDIIEEARDYSPAFKARFGGELAPLRRLSRIEQALASAIVRLDAEALSTPGTIALAAITTALAANGILTIPAYVTIIDVKATLTTAAGGGECTVARVTRTQQYRTGAPFPSVVLADSQFRLTDLRRIGKTEHGWEDLEEINYDYVPLPASLTSLDSTLTLPDGLGGVLVSLLAEWMAGRVPGSGVSARELRDERQILMADFLGTVSQQGYGDTWHVLDR